MANFRAGAAAILFCCFATPLLGHAATQPIGTDAATEPNSGSGAGAAVARKAFAPPKGR